MVNRIESDRDILYQREARGLHYENKEVTERCEAWCQKQRSCNLEIIKYAEENILYGKDTT